MPLYTDMIMDNFEDYANHHEDDGVIKLQNMPEDASMEQWGAKLQEIADEFICAPRYFLMCWLASYCQDKDLLDDETYTREFPAFTYQREGGRKKFEFQSVSKEHAQNLEEDERDQYIDILSEIAASHSGDKKAEWRGVFRTAFLWHKKKKKLISKEDGFKIAHGLDMSYTLTDFFLTRVLENDGFDFTKSADVIHAYCCFRSKCYQDFLELESLYAEAAKDVTQGTIEEKPEHFTEGMLPGDEEGVGRNQDDNSLFGLVEKWKSENIEIVDAEKHLDNVDLKFIDWMKEKAPFLDLPGKTACEIFKRLTAFVYADTKDRQQKLEIQRENDQNASDDDWDDEESLEEDAWDNVEQNIVSDLKGVYSEGSLWKLNQVVGEAFVKEIQKCLNELSGKLYKNHPERLARYLSVDANGEVNITVITSRLPLLLSGKANVTKADMLFMLWVAYTLYQRETGEPETLSDRVWSFMELANDVLEKAFLPAFYIPHILERSFLISLCMNGLESENEDIFYFGESPYEIYAAMCQFSVSVTKA